MLNIGDRVFINIPLQAGFLKQARAKREYNRRATYVTGIIGERYTLAADDGKFEWDERVLAKIVRKA